MRGARRRAAKLIYNTLVKLLQTTHLLLPYMQYTSPLHYSLKYYYLKQLTTYYHHNRIYFKILLINNIIAMITSETTGRFSRNNILMLIIVALGHIQMQLT